MGAVMAMIVIVGVAVVAAWCVGSFVVAGVVGRAFARSEQGEPWCLRPLSAPRERLVQTDPAPDDKIPSRAL